MLRRRSLAILATFAALVGGLVLGAPAAEAAPVITPWQTSVAVGGTMSVSANGCPLVEEETDTSYTSQRAELRLLVGTGPTQRFAGYAAPLAGVRQRITVPGWADPEEDAAIVGSCTRVTFDFGSDEETVTTVFTYPPAPIDITPGTPAITGPIISLSRSTAAAGQAVRVTITGCEGAEYASATLLRGDDLTLEEPDYVTGDGALVEGGTAVVDLLLASSSFGGEDDDASIDLSSGPYLVVGSCYTDDGEVEALSAPTRFTIDGTTPWESITYDVTSSSIDIAGEGCDGGRTVTVRYLDYGFVEEVEASRALGRAIAQGDLSGAARAKEANALGPEATELTVTPEADGSWTSAVPIGDGSYVRIEASCGDPLADGFTYAPGSFFLGGPFADVYAERTSPTSSPTGGPVSVSILGDCEDGATAALFRDDELVVSSSSVVPNWDLGARVTLVAPDEPGTYELVAMCGDDRGDYQEYEVFAPQQVSGTAPLAPDATSGWPEQGRREVYEGRIGPISLPAMDMGDGEEPMASGSSGSRALGPSGLFIDIPRPEGDFAITKLDMNLVDADGMPVDATQAHLHHFVFGAADGKNPACPNGSTFGIPGSIIAAAGAEKTVLDIGDPYGIVVDAEDDWKGVYELMSRSMEDQTVFLTYDITYRRDVQNVRPVSRYFGSATGCGTFNWTIDGSGTPDTQSTYIEIQKSGRLIGGGAHIHNGAMHADIVNDRGRRLCRSEITYGTQHVGHGMPMLRRAVDEPTTTIVDEPTMEYPPEFYDDDLEIDSISTCPLAEAVTAGERIRFDAVYENERPRSGVMGIYTLLVWEGGGPAGPGGGAVPIPGSPSYTG